MHEWENLASLLNESQVPPSEMPRHARTMVNRRRTSVVLLIILFVMYSSHGVVDLLAVEQKWMDIMEMG